jgi:hypothetical protein
MAHLRPVPAVDQASTATFVHKDLHKCTHVFLRQNATHRALEPTYNGPYQVLSRGEKTLQLLVRGKPVTMSADRVKPAYVLKETESGSTTFNHHNPSHSTTGYTATASSYPDYAFRSSFSVP